MRLFMEDYEKNFTSQPSSVRAIDGDVRAVENHALRVEIDGRCGGRGGRMPHRIVRDIPREVFANQAENRAIHREERENRHQENLRRTERDERVRGVSGERQR